jgi:hypothetical protein
MARGTDQVHAGGRVKSAPETVEEEVSEHVLP